MLIEDRENPLTLDVAIRRIDTMKAAICTIGALVGYRIPTDSPFDIDLKSIVAGVEHVVTEWKYVVAQFKERDEEVKVARIDRDKAITDLSKRTQELNLARSASDRALAERYAAENRLGDALRKNDAIHAEIEPLQKEVARLRGIIDEVTAEGDKLRAELAKASTQFFVAADDWEQRLAAAAEALKVPRAQFGAETPSEVVRYLVAAVVHERNQRERDRVALHETFAERDQARAERDQARVERDTKLDPTEIRTGLDAAHAIVGRDYMSNVPPGRLFVELVEVLRDDLNEATDRALKYEARLVGFAIARGLRGDALDRLVKL